MLPFSKITSATVAAIALLTLPACSSVNDQEQKASGKPPSSELVEKVNGVPVTRADLDRAVKVLLKQSRMPQTLPPETLKKATDTALDQLTSAELLYQAASKTEIKDLDKQVSERIARLKSKYPSQAELEKALESMDMSLKFMEEAIRKEVVINAFVERQFAPQATVSPDEVKKFYEDNKDKAFKQGERVQVSHILVPVSQKSTPEAKKQAKEKALALLKRLQAGADFAALAKAESASPSKAAGGDIGIVAKGQTVPEFEKAAFALKAGRISDVVETRFGYHIIKVAQRLAASTENYQEVEAKIANHLKQEKVRKAVVGYIQELRAKAKIEKG